MFSFFRRSPKEPPLPEIPLVVDMHSHLLPGLDDGSENLEESMVMIREFVARGYRRLYTTPHIIKDFYPNGPDTIAPALALVQAAIKAEGLPIQLEAAAEYFLDEHFLAQLDAGERLLTFGGKYLLFETAFLNEPVYLRDVSFKLFTSGYVPVIAHPERYSYLWDKWPRVVQLYDSGVLFQINALSLLGYYNKGAQVLAEKLIAEGMVHFVGTDCHKPKHQEIMLGLAKNKHFHKALQLPLMNNGV